MKLSNWILVLILLVPMAAMAQLRATDLEDPSPISIPDGVDAEAVHDAIVDALFRRDWDVHSEETGNIVADLHVRDHWARIGITYDEDSVRIEYQDSENLHYDRQNGREIIHRNYLGWVDRLVTEIRRELRQASRNR